MARADKQPPSRRSLSRSTEAAGAVLTEYRGLTVKQLQELRRSLGENANYAVVKNTLAKLAAKEAGIDGFDDLLTGPTAIAFIKGDVVEAAKGLRDFAKANPTLVIKGGSCDGKPLDAQGGRQAGRPRVARGAAGQAGGRDARVAQPGRLPAQRPDRPGRPARRCARRQKAEQDPSILAGGSRIRLPAAAEEARPHPWRAPSDEVTEAPADQTTEARHARRSRGGPGRGGHRRL